MNLVPEGAASPQLARWAPILSRVHVGLDYRDVSQCKEMYLNLLEYLTWKRKEPIRRRGRILSSINLDLTCS